MKNKLIISSIALSISMLLSGCDSNSNDGQITINPVDTIEQEAKAIVDRMTTREKITQKIVMSFRYDCTDDEVVDDKTCTRGLTEIRPFVEDIINKENIGGVILFAPNAATLDQTVQLTTDMQNAVGDNQKLGLFMAVDQEGGNVVRLPRATATNFVGNMGLGAVYESTQDSDIAFKEGKILAQEVKAAGFNVDFAPNVDVQSNSLNPVINVRSYGENPQVVGLLGGQAAKGMATQGVIATFKHFPGHGDTATDSHYGMPLVDRPRDDIEKIELLPYKTAIDGGYAPDMIMSAHIQYPTLDDSQFTSSKTGDMMYTPSTLSRKIQHDILRGELGYNGVTITDALDMDGIKAFFTRHEATLKVFQAGVDIALMPELVHANAELPKFTALVDQLVEDVESGQIDTKELDESVMRIVKLKLTRGILNSNDAVLVDDLQQKAREIIGKAESKALETELAQKAITLLKNENGILPATEATLGHIYVATPVKNQADGFLEAFKENNILNVEATTFAPKNWDITKEMIDNADTVIIGTQSTSPTPVDLNGDLTTNIPSGTNDAKYARYILEYAKQQGKQVITIALRAPYDIVNYDDLSDASLAIYNFYGYENGAWIGQSIRESVKSILGKTPINGRLPVNIYQFVPDETPGATTGTLGNLVYKIGDGIQLN